MLATLPKLATRGTEVNLGPWQCCAQPPGATSGDSSHWLPAIVPGTVAVALQASGQWNLRQPLDADASDWWYRTAFDKPDLAPGQSCFLCCDGLATRAEIWLN